MATDVGLPIATFIVGLIVGVLATIAAFRASVAVLGSESKRHDARLKELEERLINIERERSADAERTRTAIAAATEPIRRGLANMMLKLGGVHRWEDARDIIGGADLDRLAP